MSYFDEAKAQAAGNAAAIAAICEYADRDARRFREIVRKLRA